MNCEQITPYLAGFVGNDLRPETAAIVGGHLRTCVRCRAEVERHERVAAGLTVLAAREAEPPAYLLDAVLETTQERSARRMLPILPLPPAEVARLVSDNREAIVSAAGAALVGAGAVYALWRALRGNRATEPATP